MLRVLMIRRQKQGGIATASNHLVKGLEELGIEAVIDDMEEAIPDETGFWIDRKVHAWGYRAAWACGEAFYIRFPWIYTAQDYPRTKNTLLIDRLNHAKAGVCTSRAAKEELESVDTMHLSVIAPALFKPTPEHDQTAARNRLGVPVDAFIAVCVASDREGRGVASFVQAVREAPAVHGVVVSNHKPDFHPRLTHLEQTDIPWVIAASNVVVVPGTHQSFSMVALEAMHADRPVLMRTSPGIEEMGVPGVHYHDFSTNDQMIASLQQASEDQVNLRATTEPARMRADDWFGMTECARRYADLYRQVLGAG